jgi:hypothetical protein
VTRARAGAIALALAIAWAAGCKAQEDAFYATTFPCDLTAAEDQCGTTRAGKPMMCFAASQLGGTDFCTEACDPAAPAPSGFTCLTSGALLQACRPHAGPDDPAGLCPHGLHCYRTDLLSDQGVCVVMPVCNVDDDCKDPARSVCAATLIREVSSLLSAADHLQCVKPTCKTSTSACANNEACLADYYVSGTQVSDICVPNCDGTGHCPPNFSCAWTPATPESPKVCLPGLPGQRCQADQDCILGQCADTGAGFSECAIPFGCATDADCNYLDGLSTFACAEGIPGAGRRCVQLTSFNGANCNDDAGCTDGQRCFTYSPYTTDQGKGECRVPCDADLGCPARGGVPHTCLDGGGGGCYPGVFGMPCRPGAADCLSDFACLPAPPNPQSIVQSPAICTKSCAGDADCTGDPLIAHGYCAPEGVCRMTGAPGAACDQPDQCASGVCAGGGQCG